MAEKYHLVHISTGEVIRNQIKQGTELGKKAAGQMEGGGLVSDELVLEIIADCLVRNKDARGTIFDGFPRTVAQAEAFDKMLAEMNESVSVTLSLEPKDQTLIDRLLNRGKIEGRADDMSEEIIRNRIKVYKEQTAPVKDFYRKQNKVVEIDGEKGIENTFQQISSVLDRMISQ